MDEEDLNKRVNELVQFLSTRRELPEYNVTTVMELTRELARYKHELAESRKSNSDLHNMLKARDTMGFEEDPYRRAYNPSVMQIPPNARSVEVKF